MASLEVAQSSGPRQDRFFKTPEPVEADENDPAEMMM
jgi:hypothetical protein